MSDTPQNQTSPDISAPSVAGQGIATSDIASPRTGAPPEGGAKDNSSLTTLPDVISRAMALLDNGDLLAAKELSSKAYQDAKYAGQMGKRVHGADKLIQKARQLQGDALLIESRARIGLADEYDAAQERGDMPRGRPKKSVGGDDTLTLADFGLSRDEMHQARKLSNAEKASPGIIEQAIAARLANELEPTKAAVKHHLGGGSGEASSGRDGGASIGTKKAPKEEQGLQLHETPRVGILTLMGLEKFHHSIRDSAVGRGAIGRVLEEFGHSVIPSDIKDYGYVTNEGVATLEIDFLKMKNDGIEADFVLNPPYGDVVNPFIAHVLREFKPRKLAALVNLNLLSGYEDDDRNFFMDAHPPSRIYTFKHRLPMMHRDGWEGKKASSSMNTMWCVWQKKANGDYPIAPSILRRVDWKFFEDLKSSSSRRAIRPDDRSRAGNLAGRQILPCHGGEVPDSERTASRQHSGAPSQAAARAANSRETGCQSGKDQTKETS